MAIETRKGSPISAAAAAVSPIAHQPGFDGLRCDMPHDDRQVDAMNAVRPELLAEVSLVVVNESVLQLTCEGPWELDYLEAR